MKNILAFAPVTFALVIFVADTLTRLEIAVAVLYIVVILLTIPLFSKKGVIRISLMCVLLTILSFLLSHRGSRQAGLINSGISIFAVLATTYLALRIESARAAIQEARAQLEHVSRLTTLGELTVSIAHEVNQPLAAVVANGNASLRWLATQPANLNEARGAVEQIIADARRASDIISRIRYLARRRPQQRESININDIVIDVIALARNEIERNGISLRVELARDLPSTVGDRVQLQQVLLNLIINSVEAMAGNSSRDKELLIASSAANNSTSEITVSLRDSGVGIEKAQLEEIFDAFYTTKSDGLGMGLAICRSIVESHNGKIWAAKNSPQGTTVYFTLPVTPHISKPVND